MQPNEWANFSCTVHCGLFPVKWHKAGLENPIVAGLEFKIFNNSTCNSEDKATYILEVLATNASNNSAFYCAAYESCIGCPQTNCKCGCFGRCYSRPAFLIGKLDVCIWIFVQSVHLTFYNHIVEKMDAAVTTTLHPTPSSLHPEQGIALTCTYISYISTAVQLLTTIFFISIWFCSPYSIT